MKLKTLTPTGKSGSMTVSDAVFASPVNEQLLAQAIRVYIDRLHQGTSKVQTRSNVSLTKSKWYRQKGTGNARHGSKNAPIFVGGGVAHGPTGLRPAKLTLTPTLKRKALLSALSAQQENLVVIDDIAKLDGKTKSAAALLAKAELSDAKVLVVLNEAKPEVLQSLRNIEKVLVVPANQVSAYDVVSANTIVLTSDAVKALEARLGETK